jgi:hypothetical protein
MEPWRAVDIRNESVENQNRAVEGLCRSVATDSHNIWRGAESADPGPH